MKKLLIALMLLALALLVPALAEDAVSSASVSDFYADAALTGDDLMDALNSFSGFYIISTVNPDGTPLSAFFIYGCVKLEDTYYLQLGLAENQSRQNLIANGKGMAVYAAAPSSEEGAKPFAVSGARMTFEIVTDEELLGALNPQGGGSTLFGKIVSVRPLG